MTTDVLFYPHALRATAVAGGAELFCATLLDDITAANNFQDLTSFASAQVGPQFTGAHMAAPDFRFSSPQLGTLLSVLAAGEYYISRDLSAYNVDGWYRAGHNLGQREADATLAHMQLRMQSNAMLAMESLAADEGQLATGRFRCAAVLNSQTGLDPLVPTAGVALAGNASGGSLFTLGPVVLNGLILKGGNYMGIEFNPEYDEESSHGDGFLTYIGIRRYRPVITVRTRKTSYFATYGTRGLPLSSLTCYLRNKLASGINVADATPQHIKITCGTGSIKPREVRGDKSLLDLTIEPYQAAQNSAPVVIAVNQQIT